MEHEDGTFRGRRAPTRRLKVTGQDVCLADPDVRKEAVGGLGIGPVLAYRRNALAHGASHHDCAQPLLQPLVGKPAARELLFNHASSPPCMATSPVACCRMRIPADSRCGTARALIGAAVEMHSGSRAMELAHGSSVEQDRSYRRESVKKAPFSAVTSALKPAENWDFWYSRVPSGLVQDPPVPPPHWSKIGPRNHSRELAGPSRLGAQRHDGDTWLRAPSEPPAVGSDVKSEVRPNRAR